MGIDSARDDRAKLLADPATVAILSALESGDGEVHVEALAEQLLDRDVNVVRAAEYRCRAEQTVVVLHHDRLPRLADAGLVDYDPETNVVRSRGSPATLADWSDSGSPGSAIGHALGTGVGDSAGAIEGREAVIEYGRSLADRADEELFTIYVSTALLEDECIERVQRALDRGVEMYLGSDDPEVREVARSHLPEATVWEPQVDWTNSASWPRVGRLVMADRESVMLAVLDGSEATDDPVECALVGEGKTHPLVVLVRDLLGQRLDHLDFQSEDFTSQLYS